MLRKPTYKDLLNENRQLKRDISLKRNYQKKINGARISANSQEKVNNIKTSDGKTSGISRDETELYLDIISHDITNKNAVTILSSQLLVEDLTLDDKQRVMIGRILNSAKASSRIIENIKKLREIEQEDLEEHSVNLDDLLDDVMNEYSNMPKDVSIEHDCYGVSVRANDLLREVFSNLIDNAIKYSGESVCVIINAAELDREVVISVEDNGNGISDEMKKRILNPSSTVYKRNL